MTVTTAVKTLRGGIKPVGEALPINLTWTGESILAGESAVRNYDFYLDQDYVLTSLEIVKTAGALLADSSLSVEVLVYPPDATEDSELRQIALATLQASAAVGTKAIAGVLTGTLTVGDDPTAGNETNHFANGSAPSDQIQPIAANQPTAGSNPSQQRLRFRITGNNADDTTAVLNLSCFILAEFASYSRFKRTGQAEITTVVG